MSIMEPWKCFSKKKTFLPNFSLFFICLATADIHRIRTWSVPLKHGNLCNYSWKNGNYYKLLSPLLDIIVILSTGKLSKNQLDREFSCLVINKHERYYKRNVIGRPWICWFSSGSWHHSNISSGWNTETSTAVKTFSLKELLNKISVLHTKSFIRVFCPEKLKNSDCNGCYGSYPYKYNFWGSISLLRNR